MNLSDVLTAFTVFAFRRPLRAQRPPAVLLDPALDGVLEDSVREPTVCGWFDSSWALNAGLQITEHASVDRVVNELPLAWWLAWQPAAQQLGAFQMEPGRLSA